MGRRRQRGRHGRRRGRERRHGGRRGVEQGRAGKRPEGHPRAAAALHRRPQARPPRRRPPPLLLRSRRRRLQALCEALGRCPPCRAQADARGDAHLLYAHSAAAPGGRRENWELLALR
uniref:Uncharacterized protein n=1 Tax=Arundo donax TaxID=35708 RepID=A0A0A9EAK9_ARUDO